MARTVQLGSRPFIQALTPPFMSALVADLEPALATDLLRREHAQLAAAFACYAAALAADAERSGLASAVAANVTLHLATDRRMLYPLVRHEADEVVQRLLGHQAGIEAAVDDVLGAGEDDVRDAAVTHLARLVSGHASVEEEQLFPLVEPRLPNTLRRLRVDLERRRPGAEPALAAVDPLLVFAFPSAVNEGRIAR